MMTWLEGIAVETDATARAMMAAAAMEGTMERAANAGDRVHAGVVTGDCTRGLR